jgi:hypothetical protein
VFYITLYLIPQIGICKMSQNKTHTHTHTHLFIYPCEKKKKKALLPSDSPPLLTPFFIYYCAVLPVLCGQGPRKSQVHLLEPWGKCEGQEKKGNTLVCRNFTSGQETSKQRQGMWLLMEAWALALALARVDLLSFPEVQMRCPGLMVENWMAYAYIHNSDNLNSKAVFIGSVV